MPISSLIKPCNEEDVVKAQVISSMLNQLLGGHYRVVQNLGEGGLAKTYIAEDLHRPGRPRCALKVLKPAYNDPDLLYTARRLFHQEAEILEKLGQHDQIPRLLAYFEENQEFYLVQEFVEGHTLTLEMKPNHGWSEDKVIQMLKDVLPTLEFVHQYHVIHRDLKPNNLIRRKSDGRLVLIDFGAVKQIRDPGMMTNLRLTQKTISIGTHGYVPIEQLRGKPRFNSDIYALGMICIQALTGLDPLDFDEDEDGEVIWQDLVDVSDKFASVINKMVRYHFPDRYQSATQVLQELKAYSTSTALFSPTLVNGDTQNTEEKSPSEPVKTYVAEQENPEKFINAESSQPTEIMNSLVPTPKYEQVFPPTIVVRKSSSPSVAIKEKKKRAEKKKQDGEIIPESSKPVFVQPSKLTIFFGNLNRSQLLAGLGIVSILGIIFGSYGYLTYRNHYLQAQADLEAIKALKAEQKYQECQQKAQVFPTNFAKLHQQAQSLFFECQEAQAQTWLNQAQELAKQSRYKDAIALTQQIPAQTEVHPQAQQSISGWAEKLFTIASNKYQEGNLPEAVAIAQAIPQSSSWAKKAKESIETWNQEWTKNQEQWQNAQKALSERRWQDAINIAQKLGDTKHWQKQKQTITQTANNEIAKARAAIARRSSSSSSRTTASRASSSVRRTSSTGSSRSGYSATRRSSSSGSSSRRVYRSTKSTPRYTKSTTRRATTRRSTPAPNSNPSIRVKSRSVTIKTGTHSGSSSGSRSSGSRSDNWTCTNNPNPKCR